MSTIKVDNLQTTGGADQYTTKAWANFIGSNTVSIRDDGNVSSITDNGTGNYTCNFSTSMSNATYCAGLSATDNGTTSGQTDGYSYGSWARGSTNVVYSTSSLRFGVGYAGLPDLYDQSHLNVSVIGDLA